MTKPEFQNKASEIIGQIRDGVRTLHPYRDPEDLENDAEILVLLAGELSVLAGDMAEQKGENHVNT